MPYNHKEYKIPVSLDARRKLTIEDKELILNLYKTGLGIRAIARRFESKCSRRLIQFIIFPSRLKVSNYSGHWKKYYNKEKNNEYSKAYRHRKQKLKLQNKLERTIICKNT